MGKVSLVKAFLAVLLVSVSVANADYVANCAPDADGNIALTAPNQWTEQAPEGAIKNYTLSMEAAQNASPAHMEGDFTATTPGDPRVWILEDVENTMSFSWTGYEFAIWMSQPFSVIGAQAPSTDWTYAPSLPYTAVAGVNPNTNANGYLAVVNFSTNVPGAQIDPTEFGTFGLRVQFDGTIAFCTEQTPTPEPATLFLLVAGLVGFVIKRR